MPLLERSGGQNVFGHACRSPASATEIRLAFAGMLQVPRKHGWRLQECCKSHGDTVGVCRNAASPTETRLAFAGILQVPRKHGWRLQECCKPHGNTVGVCGTPASPTEIRLAFAGMLQAPRKYGWRLRDFRRHSTDFILTSNSCFIASNEPHSSAPTLTLRSCSSS